MPYRLCGSDCNCLPSSLGRLLPCRGPPKLHRAEPHPWSEEGWQRGSHKPGQLGTERPKSCIAPTPESRGPRRTGVARARHHGQVALETEVAELVALALALKPEPLPGSGQCSCGFVFWLPWVWFGFIKKKPKRAFVEGPSMEALWQATWQAGRSRRRTQRARRLRFYNCKWMSSC